MDVKCFECGKPAECEHHVVPKSLGGIKTVPLCLKCHGIIHNKDLVKLKRLQMIGIAKAKANIHMYHKHIHTSQNQTLALGNFSIDIHNFQNFFKQKSKSI